tara:strand:- start:44 stop:1312 length:1269 start_codon:yes stop_codon:yes gene_type:complete
MIRLTFYIILAILLALVAAWVVAHPGDVRLVWQSWEIQMSFATFAALALLYSLALWGAGRVWRMISNLAPLKSAVRRRRQRGEAELDKGWSALALDDREMARRHARRARNSLGERNDVLRLLSACESDKKRQEILNILRRREETAAFALKELLDDALKGGDYGLALSLARELNDRQPGVASVLRRIVDIEIHYGHWQAAEKSLIAAHKKSAYSEAEFKHLSALLHYVQAVEADVAGQKDLALTEAQTALKKDASFLPAASLAARLLLTRKETGKARKIIENTWKIRPHPELAELFLDLAPQESPTERFRRVDHLVRFNPDHRESRHLLAAAAIAAGHWPEARQALDRVVKADQATSRTWQLYALLEQKQKQDMAAAESYLARARTAPAEAAWHCKNCGYRSAHYAATCPECHRFDSLDWKDG